MPALLRVVVLASRTAIIWEIPAYLRAIGVGLSVAPDSFEIPAPPAAGSLIFEVPEDAGPTASWTVREITSHTGYAGALVVEGSPWELLTQPCHRR